MQPAITAALAGFLCQSEKTGPVDTHEPFAAPQMHTHTRTSTRTQKSNPARRAGTHMQKGPTRPTVDGQWTWGSGLATVKRGTISCPSASKKSTQGTRANIFSTQIGYSNYPRLFNLATGPESPFQVPTTNTARIGGSGPDGCLFQRSILVAMMCNCG